MDVKNLYIYCLEDGTEVHSPVQPECEYTLGYRLISRQGWLVNSEGKKTKIIDTLDPNLWTEIEESENQETKQ